MCLKCLLNRLSFICLFSIVIFYYKYSIVLYIFFGIINVSWILVVVKYTLLGVLILVYILRIYLKTAEKIAKIGIFPIPFAYWSGFGTFK